MYICQPTAQVEAWRSDITPQPQGLWFRGQLRAVPFQLICGTIVRERFDASLNKTCSFVVHSLSNGKRSHTWPSPTPPADSRFAEGSPVRRATFLHVDLDREKSAWDEARNNSQQIETGVYPTFNRLRMKSARAARRTSPSRRLPCNFCKCAGWVSRNISLIVRMSMSFTRPRLMPMRR